MSILNLFQKNKNKQDVASEKERDFPKGIVIKCPQCKQIHVTKQIEQNFKVCPKCQFHFTMNATERVASFIDEGTFEPLDEHLQTTNPLQFPGYLEKVQEDMKKTTLSEAVITGIGSLKGQKIVLAVMDSTFRMGSMGSVVGEKITRAIEKATSLQVPFIIFTASGGARMQEGVLSLMQMAKTSVALSRHSEAGLLYISIMTHPTTGGVSASFASVGDLNIAEPQSLIGFAGRRVIEQTVREKLPDDFQTAEFLLAHGQLDAIVNRLQMRDTIALIVQMHTYEGGAAYV